MNWIRIGICIGVLWWLPEIVGFLYGLCFGSLWFALGGTPEGFAAVMIPGLRICVYGLSGGVYLLFLRGLRDRPLRQAWLVFGAIELYRWVVAAASEENELPPQLLRFGMHLTALLLAMAITLVWRTWRAQRPPTAAGAAET